MIIQELIAIFTSALEELINARRVISLLHREQEREKARERERKSYREKQSLEENKRRTTFTSNADFLNNSVLRAKTGVLKI